MKNSRSSSERQQTFGSKVCLRVSLRETQRGKQSGSPKAMVSPATSYELLHESGFPSLKIGNRIVVPKEQFIQWVENHVTEGER